LSKSREDSKKPGEKLQEKSRLQLLSVEVSLKRSHRIGPAGGILHDMLKKGQVMMTAEARLATQRATTQAGDSNCLQDTWL